MAEIRDFFRVRIPPPLWYVTAIAAGVGLDNVVPFSLDPGRALRVILPAVLALAFVALAPRAISLFHRTHQNPTPWTPAKELITSGPYRFTRNPMYVGMACLQLAVGLALANGWIVVLLPLVLVAVYATAIRFEEAYLRAEFGQAYDEYVARVRRWL